jgi:hypothetical protein
MERRTRRWTALVAVLVAGAAARGARAAPQGEPADPPPEGAEPTAEGVVPTGIVLRGREGVGPVRPPGTGDPTAGGVPRDDGGIRAGMAAGYEQGRSGGPTLRALLEIPSRDVSPRARLSWAVSVAWARLSRNDQDPVAERTTTASVLTAVGGPRVTLLPRERVGLWAEAGAGLYHAGSRVRRDFAFALGSRVEHRTHRGLAVHLGAGAWVDASPRVRLGAGLGVEPYVGGLSQTSLLVQAGFAYRL